MMSNEDEWIFVSVDFFFGSFRMKVTRWINGISTEGSYNHHSSRMHVPFIEMRISIWWIAKKGTSDPFNEMKDNDKHDIYQEGNADENVHVGNNNAKLLIRQKKICGILMWERKTNVIVNANVFRYRRKKRRRYQMNDFNENTLEENLYKSSFSCKNHDTQKNNNVLKTGIEENRKIIRRRKSYRKIWSSYIKSKANEKKWEQKCSWRSEIPSKSLVEQPFWSEYKHHYYEIESFVANSNV